MRDWSAELKTAIKLSPHHLSLYQLTIEKGTKFYSQYRNGEFAMPNADLAAEFYQLTNKITDDFNLPLYEISNYGTPKYQSKHNLVYWQSGDYLGIGAGAHSRIYFDGEKSRSAITLISEPNLWMEKALTYGAAIQKQIQLTQDELCEELILMGLRLDCGIKNNIFKKLLGKNLMEIFDLPKLQFLIDNNYLEINQNHIRITDRGRLLTDSIIKKLCLIKKL